MKKTILAMGLALLTTQSALAALQINTDLEGKFFNGIRCRDQVFAQLDSMRTTREWSLPNAREMDGSRRFLSPTGVIGVWVEARIFMNGEVLLRRITSNFVETRTFDLQTCQLAKTARKTRELFDNPSQSRAGFNDGDIRELLAHNPRGLIYIWSPNMPYSYQQRVKGKSGIEEIEAIGRKLGMKVTVVLDPAASTAYASKIIAQNSYMKTDAMKSVNSIELSLRSMRTHYPALLVYANGQLARHGYPGLGTTEEYSKYIRGELNELEK